MRKKGIIFYVFIYVVFSCKNQDKSNSESILKPIENILLGQNLDTVKLKEIDIQTDKLEVYGKYKFNDSIATETLLYIKSSNLDSTYNLIRDFYNGSLNDSLSNRTFNSWQSDSIEYLLFKKSDSTIFANIYLKTYN